MSEPLQDTAWAVSLGYSSSGFDVRHFHHFRVLASSSQPHLLRKPPPPPHTFWPLLVLAGCLIRWVRYCFHLLYAYMRSIRWSCGGEEAGLYPPECSQCAPLLSSLPVHTPLPICLPVHNSWSSTKGLRDSGSSRPARGALLPAWKLSIFPQYFTFIFLSTPC